MIGDITLVCTVCQTVYQLRDLSYDFPDNTVLQCCATPLQAVQFGVVAKDHFTGHDVRTFRKRLYNA